MSFGKKSEFSFCNLFSNNFEYKSPNNPFVTFFERQMKTENKKETIRMYLEFCTELELIFEDLVREVLHQFCTLSISSCGRLRVKVGGC